MKFKTQDSHCATSASNVHTYTTHRTCGRNHEVAREMEARLLQWRVESPISVFNTFLGAFLKPSTN